MQCRLQGGLEVRLKVKEVGQPVPVDGTMHRFERLPHPPKLLLQPQESRINIFDAGRNMIESMSLLIQQGVYLPFSNFMHSKHGKDRADDLSHQKNFGVREGHANFCRTTAAANWESNNTYKAKRPINNITGMETGGCSHVHKSSSTMPSFWVSLAPRQAPSNPTRMATFT